MNSWANEHFSMPNMIGMVGVMPNLVPSITPSLVQPYTIISDMNQMSQHMNQIGPTVVNQVSSMNLITPSTNQIAIPITQIDRTVNKLAPGTFIETVKLDPQVNVVAIVEELNNGDSGKQEMNV